MTGTKQIELKT